MITLLFIFLLTILFAGLAAILALMGNFLTDPYFMILFTLILIVPMVVGGVLVLHLPLRNPRYPAFPSRMPTRIFYGETRAPRSQLRQLPYEPGSNTNSQEGWAGYDGSYGADMYSIPNDPDWVNFSGDVQE